MNAKFRSSAETDKIDAALVKAQAKIRPAIKDAQNPHFKSSFASFASIFEACRGPMSEAGIAILQPASADGNTVTVTTRLAHAGQFYEADLSVTLAQNSAQAVGSALSYLKRYGLAALAGVPTADEDDDAEAAVGRPGTTSRPDTGTNGSAKQNQAAIDSMKRKAGLLRQMEERYPGRVRVELAHLLKRTFPDKEEIRLSNNELNILEASLTLAQAVNNSEQAAAGH